MCGPILDSKEFRIGQNKPTGNQKGHTILIEGHNSIKESNQIFNGEFDPGSGRTLAACLTHASRTDDKGLAP